MDQLAMDQLRRAWRSPTGLASVTAVNHRIVGKRYIFTGLIFMALAGILALTMVTQLSTANRQVLNPEAYAQFFTMHGTTMMFLFAVPIMEGVGIYIVPLMIGARDLAFPKLSAFGYWVYLIAGITLYAALLLGEAPNAGWYNYVPLAGPEFSPGLNIDFYATAITFLEISAITAAVELIITIFKERGPGMSLNRIPIFVWAILGISFMIVFAFPPLMIGSTFLALDRLVGTHFYNVALGGSPLLWQHLFWWFGHPEVYIIAIPAFGMVSTIIPTFAQRRIIAYLPVVLALGVISLVSFGLWVHHMFALSISWLGMSYFSAASMAIGIPSGVQVFAWIGTLWASKGLVWKTPLLWVVGFIPLFLIGGITGIMVAAIPFDWQVTDSQFITAHFHYVLIGGSVFPLFGALYYWLPKVTGRLMSETLGKISFWFAFIGFNIAFFTLHFTGLMGMPRRVYTYGQDAGWGTTMSITLAGAIILATGFALTFANIIWSLFRGRPAGDNPWNAPTLEWSTSSPPPPYNFATTPVVHSRTPLWDERETGQHEEIVFDVDSEVREMMGTTPLDATPEQRILVPKPSIWPLILAIAVGIAFIGSIFNLLFFPIGALLSLVALVGWAWPGSRHHREVKHERFQY